MRTEKKVSPAIQNQVKRKAKSQSGYTVVELLLVLLLLFLVVSIITLTYFTSANASKLVIDTSSAEIDARTAMYLISKELREATQVTEADADRITFVSDIDSDQVIDEVSYYLQSQQGHYMLYKSVNGGQGRFVASNIIDNNLFSYHSSPDTELSAPVDEEELENIGVVGISLVIDKTGEQSERTMELETLVTLRNKL